MAYITHIIQGYIYVRTRGTVTGGMLNARARDRKKTGGRCKEAGRQGV